MGTPHLKKPVSPSPLVVDQQESCPVTPINRSFQEHLDPTFATAILSPSSNEVFAARTRARSRSEACLKRNDVEDLVSVVKKPKLTVNAHECKSTVDHQDDSSIERSLEDLDQSMSRFNLSTPDTSFESSFGDSRSIASRPSVKITRNFAHGDFQTKRGLTPSLNIHSQLQTLRRKSNTISVPADKRPNLSDVFGPNLPLELSAFPIQSNENDQKIEEKRPFIPRRMTIGGPAYALRSISSYNKPMGKLQRQPSLSIVAEGVVMEEISRNNHNPTNTSSKIYPAAHSSSSASTPEEEEESLNALQHLIQDMTKKRAQHSAVLENIQPVDDQSINAVMEYRSASPTGKHDRTKSSPTCDLCGAIALRMTILEPCRHWACAACCSSGLNQVTATPPRPHVCAACHTPVKGISLRKSSVSETPTKKTPSSDMLIPSSVQRKRHQTMNKDEKLGHPIHERLFSSPSMSFSQRSYRERYSKHLDSEETRNSLILRSSTPDHSYTLIQDITDSSEPATEDASFFAIKADRHRVMSGGKMNGKYIIPPLEPHLLLIPTSKGVPEYSESNRSSFVVRMDNIPWKLTYHDVLAWLPKPVEKILPCSTTVAQSVHIPIDVVSGKTSNCCFVECRDKEQAMRLVRHRNNARLLGRPVCESCRGWKCKEAIFDPLDPFSALILTNHEDLLNEVFPFRLVSPLKDEGHCIYFTPGILSQLVQLLRSGSPQLKGPAKVVDLATSMIRLVPATLNKSLCVACKLIEGAVNSSFYRELTRLYGWAVLERVKEIICTCIMAPRELVGVHESLNRLLLASSTCACFTLTQRIDILDSARQALNAVAPQY